MVFCYQNCFDLLWEKIVLVIESFKILRSLKHWKVRTIFGNEMPLYLVHGGFSDLINYNNWNSNWKKKLGIRNTYAGKVKKNVKVFVYTIKTLFKTV